MTARRALALPLALAAALASTGGAGAAGDDWAAAFVARWQAEALAAAAAATPADARARCAELVAGGLDVGAVTDEVATAVQASPAQRPRLLAAVGRRLTADCVARRRDEADAAFTLLGVRPSGDEVFVTADVSTPAKPGRRVVWRLRAPPGSAPKALDVSIQGRSVVADVREALERLIASRGGDLERAIAALGAG
jgi:hypothetical protein